MYTNVSTECINALNADGRRFGAKITLSDKTEITDGFYSIDITSSANNDTAKNAVRYSDSNADYS